MAELTAPQQNRLLGQLANMLRTTEGDIAAPEFLPRGLDVMGLVRQLMLPSAETVEKLSYGDPLFRMPQQSYIPITADREYLADVVGMAPMVPAASSGATRLTNEAADALVRAITRNPEATAPGVLEAAGEMLPLSRMISPEVATKFLPDTKIRDYDTNMPELLFHGTTKDFKDFKVNVTPDDHVPGISLTEDPGMAYGYSTSRSGEGANVRPVYVDVKNPITYDELEEWVVDKAIEKNFKIEDPEDFAAMNVPKETLLKWLKEDGYDAIDYRDHPGLGYGLRVFDPKQIKSAISDPQMAGLLDQPAQSVAEAPKFEMPSFATLRPETEGDIDQIYDFVEQQAKKAGYRVKSGASNVSGSRYLTITEDLPGDDIRDIELRISDHGDRHPFSDTTEGKISIDPSRSGFDLEAALYELQDKGFNLLR